jgi:hypothetical protein
MSSTGAGPGGKTAVTNVRVRPRGRRADLVLIDGDPLQDIRATRSIRRIWCGGAGHAALT